MNRREALQRVSLILGGMLSAQLSAGLMGQVLNPGSSVTVDAAMQGLLAQVADVIIPTTDTPGAAAVGAEIFVMRVMQDCYLYGEQVQFYAALSKINADAQSAYGKGFAELEAAKKSDLIKLVAGSNTPFFKTLRELVIAGYFSSEIGATKALEYLPVPGQFVGDVPMRPGQKAWAQI
ncbi:MAG: gluconate 2-dehydrogenase subunit 3 family protein [Verrucomicrobia bacterium]|nr:gluconate 2-dehydrogenase subunit 3 family protein [Verrucomicrobiota bacterium]